MPRGIPNAKKDETGLRFTSFHVPLGLNPKSTGSTYIKTDLNTLWARNAARRAKEPATALEGRRGSDVIVIHPGSRFTRIGRACDINPVTVSSVIARKLRGGGTVPEPRYVPGIERPQPGMERTKPVQGSGGGDEYSVSSQSNDPFQVKIDSLVKSFRERMKFYNLRLNRDAAFVVSRFNGSFKPEVIPDAADPRKIDWITEADEDVLVGEKALRLADPHKTGYVVRWPLYGGHFNARGYPSHQLVLSDVEEILRETLKGSLSIDPKSYEDYSVVLIIPDIYERTYVKDLIDILLVKMGFKQICVQQESLATTYGAGISTACVVNIGAAVTSIACVEDGLVVPDTRILLNIGGNDITEFLYVLLERIGFPYRDLDLARSYDWDVAEDLKIRAATLDEGDVALDLWEFVVRRPDAPTKKYGLRAYDEVILAPMVLFEPKVVDFDSKLAGIHRQNLDVTDEISDVYPADRFTQAMVISTQHLVPQEPAKTKPSTTAPDPNPQPGSITNAPSVTDGAEPAPSTSAPSPASGDTTKADEEAPAGDTEAGAEEAAPTPMDVDKAKPEDESKSKTPVPGNEPAPQQQAAQQPQQPQQGPSPASQQTLKESAAPQIDLFLEASKLPLDVAIFNSTRAAGGDDKIRKYLQAILVVGGTALMPGLEHALKSRLQAIATPLVQDMGTVGIIPSQKDVDEQVLTWKGASVLGRMEGVTDMWVTGADWNTFGMRAVKERCFLFTSYIKSSGN